MANCEKVRIVTCNLELSFNHTCMKYNLNFIRCTNGGKYGTADYAKPIKTSMFLNRTLKFYVFLKTESERNKDL